VLAGLLARAGIGCTVIDPVKLAADIQEAVPDPRALAVTPASVQILSKIGIWQKIPEEKKGYFSKMEVWDQDTGAEIHFDSADICSAVMAWIVEQNVLQSALIQAVQYLPDLSLLTGCSLSSFSRDGNGIEARLSDGTRLNARLLVAADGSGSAIRELAGIRYRRYDYHQRAIAGVVQTSLPHEHIARQRFLDSGPLAFLPMSDPHTCGIVWSTDPGHAVFLEGLSDGEFCRELEQAFESRLGEVTAVVPRAGFPLFRAQAEKYAVARLALIGDAAHSLHPLAGQGANMGFLDAAALAETMISARRRGRDIGSATVLRRYERWRKGENFRMILVLDVLKRLFESRRGILPALRRQGLCVVDSIQPVKNRLMRQAMGLEGDLPAAARPGAVPPAAPGLP